MNATRLAKMTAAAAVLRAYLSDRVARLHYGERARAAMHQQVHAGSTPTGYRPRWLEASINQVLQTCKALAGDFNARFPWDAASKNDVADVLRAALAHVTREEEEE